MDISRPVDEQTVAELGGLVSRHKVLVFKEQTVSSEQLNAFAERFGNTKQEPPAFASNGRRDHNVSRLGNQEDGDKVVNPLTGYGLVSRFWHSDSSWRPVPTWLTMLAASEIPDEGGGTGFADMEAAYAALPEERKAFLDGRHMIHSWATLRRYEPSIPPMEDIAPPPATHPLVRTIDGRKSLFLNGHVCFYVGNMPQDEGEALFGELMAHATSPQFVYEHKWTVGDVAMWDNRTTMHRAMPYDRSKRRVMYRAEVQGAEAPR
ncbi:MAG: TauD/TfdA family dioxygenase [Novosphingobium sp.]|nr:TauD/TfdA family dioxygenase [Novosphingobium sp.]